MNIKLHKKVVISVLSLAVLTYILNPWLLSHASAADLSQAYIRLDRMKASTATSGLVCITPSTTHTTSVSDFQINWPTGYTVSSTVGNWAASTGTIPSGTSAFPGIASATVTVASQKVTWTFGANQTLSSATQYCFTFGSSALTNPAAATDLQGSVQLTDTTSANNETKPFALASVSNDQVTVTASVPATFSFSLGSNSIDLGTLSTSAVTAAALSSPISISTNGDNGWIAYISSNGDAKLDSVSTGDSISSTKNAGTPVTLSAGTKGYVIDASVTAGGSSVGTPSVAAEYNGGSDNTANSSSTAGGVVTTSPEKFASSNGPAATDHLTIAVAAAISGVTKAANDYTDTLNIVGAGNF